jgi:hypothetical protein
LRWQPTWVFISAELSEQAVVTFLHIRMWTTNFYKIRSDIISNASSLYKHKYTIQIASGIDDLQNNTNVIVILLSSDTICPCQIGMELSYYIFLIG